MAPQTRRTQPCQRVPAHPGTMSKDNQCPLPNATQVDTSMLTSTSRTDNTLKNGKRTLPNAPSNTDANLPGSSRPAKHARKNGPDHGRPMPLKLTSESELGEEQKAVDAPHVVKGKGKAKAKGNQQQQSSYQLHHNEDDFESLDFDDFDADRKLEKADDWVNDEYTVQLTEKYPSKVSETMAVERPTWKDTTSTDGPSSTVTVGGHASSWSSTEAVDGHQFLPMVTPGGPLSLMAMNGGQASLLSQSSGGSSHTSTLIDSQIGGSDWSFEGSDSPILDHTTQPEVVSGIPSPNDPVVAESANDPADLVFSQNSTKVMLTLQHPLMRLVIHKSFENLRLSLLFNHSFPNFHLTIRFIKDALVTAANTYRPGSEAIYQRLLNNDSYISKLIPLPRARICLIRGEIKERCSANILPTMLGMASRADIVRFVEKQLAHYNYTFPMAPNYAVNGLVLCSRPYHNDCIISVIRDLYFSGGSSSFAARYDLFFTRDNPNDNSTSRQVPIAMVSLVSTALYAALYEWRTGERISMGFSTNTFLDVYLGHVNTFEHIMENRAGAFHSMMTEIYTKANSSTKTMNANPIADLDLDTLDE